MRPADVVEATATATFPAVSVGGCAAVKGLLRRPGRSAPVEDGPCRPEPALAAEPGVRERPGRP